MAHAYARNEKVRVVTDKLGTEHKGQVGTVIDVTKLPPALDDTVGDMYTLRVVMDSGAELVLYDDEVELIS